MDPFKVVALSDMTICEARNIVFDRVKDKFLADQIQIENIEGVQSPWQEIVCHREQNWRPAKQS